MGFQVNMENTKLNIAHMRIPVYGWTVQENLLIGWKISKNERFSLVETIVVVGYTISHKHREKENCLGALPDKRRGFSQSRDDDNGGDGGELETGINELRFIYQEFSNKKNNKTLLRIQILDGIHAKQYYKL